MSCIDFLRRVNTQILLCIGCWPCFVSFNCIALLFTNFQRVFFVNSCGIFKIVSNTNDIYHIFSVQIFFRSFRVLHCESTISSQDAHSIFIVIERERENKRTHKMKTFETMHDCWWILILNKYPFTPSSDHSVAINFSLLPSPIHFSAWLNRSSWIYLIFFSLVFSALDSYYHI